MTETWTMAEVDQIIASDIPEIDKLAQVFAMITGRILEYGQGELDLLRAAGDQEALVKAQIKLSVFKHCQDIMQRCYHMITARRVPDGQDEL